MRSRKKKKTKRKRTPIDAFVPFISIRSTKEAVYSLALVWGAFLLAAQIAL